MDLIESPYDFFTSILVLSCGLFITQFIGAKLKISRNRIFLLYFYHSFFCFLYALYVFNYGGDATRYYELAIANFFNFRAGTDVVTIITTIPAYWIGFSFLTTSFIFNIFGAIGLIYFDAALQNTVSDKNILMKRIARALPFLPSISFWSSGLGKDSLMFMGIGLSLYAMQNLGQRLITLILGIVIIFLIRPHIAGIFILSLAAASIFGARISTFGKVLILGASSFGAFLVVPFVGQYVGLGENFSAVEFDEYLDARKGANLDGGSSLDIAGMSRPLRLFTYMFRPLFFDAGSPQAIASSFDNVLLLGLIGFSIFALLKARLGRTDNNRLFLFIYVALSWFVLAETTANLGIAVRQKWMIVPALLLLLFSLMRVEKPEFEARYYSHGTIG